MKDSLLTNQAKDRHEYWCHSRILKSDAKAENREEWRKRIAKSPVVPQWSARLRDGEGEVKV